MQTFSLPKLALAVALLWPLQAGATLFSLAAVLTGDQETPPVATDATGTAGITYNDQTNELGWSVTFADLSSPIVNAHFHGPAPVGVPAGVQVPIPFNAGETTDTIVGTATLTDQQEQDLLGGLWYVNVHSEMWPNGEIRGQVLECKVVPEPATALLLGAGIALLTSARRREA